MEATPVPRQEKILARHMKFLLTYFVAYFPYVFIFKTMFLPNEITSA
jgi:dolichyl-phosphate-mannose--protein O-mannosyl transferase